MATGDIEQYSGIGVGGGDSLSLTTSTGEPTNWSTPTSGNTLVIVIVGGGNVDSGLSGWTEDYVGGSGTENVSFWSKTSAGTESTIAIDFDSYEDYGMMVYEIEGEVTFDVGSDDQDSGVDSLSSGSTGTLEGPNSIAFAGGLAWDWGAGMTFDSGYTRDGWYDEIEDFYYQSTGHKALSGTTATSTTLGNFSNADCVCGVGVYTIPAEGGGLVSFFAMVIAGMFR